MRYCDWNSTAFSWIPPYKKPDTTTREKIHNKNPTETLEYIIEQSNNWLQESTRISQEI
jgi:hypothetical protein